MGYLSPSDQILFLLWAVTLQVLQPRDKDIPQRADAALESPPEEESGVTIWLDVSADENVLHLPVVTLF